MNVSLAADQKRQSLTGNIRVFNIPVDDKPGLVRCAAVRDDVDIVLQKESGTLYKDFTNSTRPNQTDPLSFLDQGIPVFNHPTVVK